MLSSDESLNRIFSTSWCARFSSHFARIKRSLTGAASPASLSCSVAEKFQRWECFSPRGNAISISQCNYQDKTFSLGGEGQSFPPWCVEIWFDWKGRAAWRVLVGSRGFCSSCVKPPCPHTIVVRCMTILPFSELPLYRILERKAGRKFHAIAAEVSRKMSNKIRCVLNFEKGIALAFIVGLPASPQPVKSSLPGLPACQLLLPVIACRGVSLHVLQAFFLHRVRTQTCVKAKHLTGETLVSLWEASGVSSGSSVAAVKHTLKHSHTHTHTTYILL